MSSLLLERGLRECGLPEGVFQVATGRGATGAALVDEADVIMFTGSTATGRKVLERAARTLTPAYVELGGKDPLIVLADADLERAANTAVYGAMVNSGQVCMSTERVYVEAPVYDEFVRRVVDKVGRLRQAPPAGPGTAEVGGITFAPQLATIERHVRDAVERGARVLLGGRRRPGTGQFFEPTVLVDVDHSMACVREETFGPALPIIRVADADEAVRLANDSPYGLCRDGVHPRRAQGRADRRPHPCGHGVGQRHPHPLHGDGPAHGRAEELRHRRPPRRRGDPQVLRAAGHVRLALAPAARHPHLPVQPRPLEAAAPHPEADVRVPPEGGAVTTRCQGWRPPAPGHRCR